MTKWTKEVAQKYARDWYLANRDQQLARAKARHKKNPEARRRSWRACRYRQYGFSIEQYEKMLEQQGYCCLICKREAWDSPKSQLVVDHNHQTGKVRGLLCEHCNRLLGGAQDQIDVLQKAILYLRGLL